MIFIANTNQELTSLVEDHALHRFNFTTCKYGKGVVQTEKGVFFCWFMEIEFND